MAGQLASMGKRKTANPQIGVASRGGVWNAMQVRCDASWFRTSDSQVWGSHGGLDGDIWHPNLSPTNNGYCKSTATDQHSLPPFPHVNARIMEFLAANAAYLAYLESNLASTQHGSRSNWFDL